MIQRKLDKGKALEEIAEDLEEPLENVKKICGAIAVCESREAAEIYRFMKEQSEREEG